LKIVVLAGGLSPERQVSLVSGENICRALWHSGHHAILVDMFLGVDDCHSSFEDQFNEGRCTEHSISKDIPDLAAVRRSRAGHSLSLFGPNVLRICEMADIVFLGLHGACGEDGRVQATFDLLGIPYTGSGYLASGMAMNKATAKQVMQYAGILTPPWQELRYTEADIPRLVGSLPLPCAIKTINGGSSLGMALPETREDLTAALYEMLSYGGHVIAEQKITGRDITIGILGDQYLPAVEMIPQPGSYFDYTAKYQAGSSQEVCPAPISMEQWKAMGETTLQLHRALGLQVYSRADFVLDAQGRAWCLEINTLPGMTPGSLLPKEAAAVGLSYTDLCEEILRLSLQKHTTGPQP